MAKIGVLSLAGVMLSAAAGGGAPAGRADKVWDPMCPCWVDGSPAGDRSPA
ncbi:hypothetical protein IIA16_05290, partial [bacterium]|nr:hypothetical protein [bacterium]